MDSTKDIGEIPMKSRSAGRGGSCT